MKLKSIKWAALILGTAINVFYSLFIVYFSGIVVIDRLANNYAILEISELVTFFLPLLCIVAIVIAWFRNKTGGILLTISALLNILFIREGYLDNPGRFIIKYPMLLAGLLLLFFVYYNSRLSAHGQQISAP